MSFDEGPSVDAGTFVVIATGRPQARMKLERYLLDQHPHDLCGKHGNSMCGPDVVGRPDWKSMRRIGQTIGDVLDLTRLELGP